MDRVVYSIQYMYKVILTQERRAKKWFKYWEKAIRSAGAELEKEINEAKSK